MKLILNPYTILPALFLSFLISLRPAHAEMTGALTSDRSAVRTEQISTIKHALEMKVVKEKLLERGMDPEQVAARLDTLNDNQLHLLSSASDDVLAGGDIFGLTIVILIIVLLIVLIIKVAK